MKTVSTFDIINSISLQKIETYLSIKGWQKKKQIEKTASIWIYTQDKIKQGIILPLDRDFVDFEDRLLEVFKILESIEKRPKIEIIDSLKNTSIIARQNNREIIEIKVSSLQGNKNEIKTKNIGLVLKSLQDFFYAFGESRSKEKMPKEKREIQSQLELSLMGTFHGSFGLRLGLSKAEYKQLELLNGEYADEEISIEATENFIELIQASSNQNSEILKKQIKNLKGEPILKFKSLISHLIGLQSNLFLDWGSVNPEKGGLAEISYLDIVKTLDIINKQELEDPVQFQVVGKLEVAGVGKTKSRRKFVLVNSTDDNQEFQGTISPEVVKKFNGHIELTKLYQVTIEEKIFINEFTGDEHTIYTIVELENISEIK